MQTFIKLTPQAIQSVDGINNLNNMLEALFQNIPGDMNTVRIFKGYGSPENVVSAGIGALYLRLDGSTSTTLYVKTAGTGATGWTAK